MQTAVLHSLRLFSIAMQWKIQRILFERLFALVILSITHY